jgi:FKBP-type peptidyl-prolyl cis-trans isomerase SlyD
MIIDDKKVVSVSYELTVNEDGSEQLVEQTEEGQPFVFLFGSGGLLDAFEDNLRGKKVGDKFDFIIQSNEGYGAREDQNIANVPLDAFKNAEGEVDTEMVQIGNYLPMVDNEGNTFNGLVQEVSDNHVIMDFNHPLADKDLHFIGEVLEIRDATSEEIAHGHVHGEGGVHHE